jgi:hypothetical protein
MALCPACRRPVAVARAACLYCGAALIPPAASAQAAAEPAFTAPTPPAEPAPGAGRELVIVDLAGAEKGALADALAVSPYEASLLVRRGGLHLHRACEPGAACTEATRLAGHGLRVVRVPESEARVRPRRAVGGARRDDRLALRTEEGLVEVRRGEVLLVVRGAIVREYQPSDRRRKVSTARLEEGYRVHLHMASRGGGDVPRPVECDAASFEFGFSVTGSARLELDAWVDAVAGGAARDDGFRRLPPALAPAAPEPRSALSAAGSLRGGRDGDAPVVLDNAEQFRFYSGWRAAVERRR